MSTDRIDATQLNTGDPNTGRRNTRRLAFLAALVALPPASLAGFSWWTARRVERLCPPRGRFIGVGRERVHIVEAGQGPPVVLVHGLAGQSGNYAYDVVDRLASSFRVVAIDRPGSGHSPRRRGARADLRAQGDLVAGVIAVLGLGRPLVVGHSLGGAIGLAAALAHPDRVGGLALIAPLTQPGAAPAVFRRLAIRSAALRFALAWTVAVPIAMLRRPATLAALFGPERPPADFGACGGGMLGLRPATFIGAAADLASAAADLAAMVERYPSLTIPVGVLFGDGDRVLDHRVHGDRLAGSIADLDLEIVPGAGHMLPVTRGANVSSFIERQAARIARAG